MGTVARSLHWTNGFGRAAAISLCLLLTCLFLQAIAIAQPARAAIENTAPAIGELTGDSVGEDWNETPADDKLSYCRKAYGAFRGAPSQSYIISSSVQAISPEGFCKRLDQFYRFDINLDMPLGEAAAIAPLLFSDVSMDY